MESWSYISDGKGLVSSNLAESSSSSISRSEFVNWVSEQHQQDTGPSFEDLEVSQLIVQQQQQIPNPMIGAMNAFREDSNSIVESGSRDLSLIDLKLGRFGVFKDHGSRFLQTHPILCSSELSVPAKRPRVVSMNSAAAYCQVYGCSKDLSSSKDYHKRHRVCEVHSKTATVIVNGIQQRFCQQCSRFHLVAEFDDTKRSCRKRLADHNERRRKPHGGAHSGRSPQPVNGNHPQGSIFTPISFICQDILPKKTGLPNPKVVKAENRVDYSPFPAIPTLNAQSRTPIPPYTFDKHLPFFHASISSLDPVDLSAFNTSVSGVSDSGCALSLLSFPSSAQFLMESTLPLSHKSSSAEQIVCRSKAGPTISLSQVSPQIQHVEIERQSEINQEHNGFCCPRTMY